MSDREYLEFVQFVCYVTARERQLARQLRRRRRAAKQRKAVRS